MITYIFERYSDILKGVYCYCCNTDDHMSMLPLMFRKIPLSRWYILYGLSLHQSYACVYVHAVWVYTIYLWSSLVMVELLEVDNYYHVLSTGGCQCYYHERTNNPFLLSTAMFSVHNYIITDVISLM